MSKLFIFSSISIALWFIYFVLIAQFYPTLSERGLFGDSFGAFSALFTGLALAGTAYAIYRQDEQSVEQEKQIQKQAELQMRTAVALERNSSIELVNLLARMRDKNAQDMVTLIKFISENAGDQKASEAIKEASASANLHVTTQGLLGLAHHASIESLITAWNLNPELISALSSLTKPHDQEKWLAIIDNLSNSSTNSEES